MSRFIEPASIEDAEDRRTALVLKLNEIEAVLGNKNATDGRGNRLDGHSYWEWRNRAVHAKRHTLAEMTHLKAWLKTARRERQTDSARDMGFDANDPTSLLRAARAVFVRIASDEVEIHPDEQFVLDAIRDYLQERASPGSGEGRP